KSSLMKTPQGVPGALMSDTAEAALAQLADQVEPLQQEQAEAVSERDTLQVRLQEKEAELRALRQESERAIEAEAKASAERAVTQAQAEWDVEMGDRLAAVRQEAERAIEEASEASEASAEAAVTQARAEWNVELESRLAGAAEEADRQREQARKEAQDKAARKLAAAKSRYEKAEGALGELGGQVEALQKAEVTYRKTQVEFSVLQNRTRTLEEELAQAQESLKKAKQNGSAEATEAALVNAREAWEAEQ
ncbi:MAG: hypothetical protein OXR03_14590, partial [Rhodospirillaceae bacterium]|nr:hypothetical protein [Rhodospirillaceae bacterium]